MATYIQIGSTVTVGSGGASYIEFTGIPATYTDLVLKTSLRSNRSLEFDSTTIQFNTTSSSNYTQRMVYGDGAAAASLTSAAITFFYATGSTATSNTFGNGEIYIPNYAGSSYKSVSMDSVSENNATTALAALNAGLWSDTSAITSIRLTVGGGTLLTQYSSASLYGIKKD